MKEMIFLLQTECLVIYWVTFAVWLIRRKRGMKYPTGWQLVWSVTSFILAMIR